MNRNIGGNAKVVSTNAEIRAAARERLRGNWAKGIAVWLIYSVILWAINFIPVLGAIASFLVAGPLILGVYVYFLRLVRRESSSVAVMFDGFQEYGRAFLTYLLMGIFVFLWSLLLIVPGIIAALRYSQAFFLLHDNPGMKASEVIRLSSDLMNGNKGRLFLLYVSFIGWALLCILTLGIGFLWLSPYITASQAMFYEELKKGAA